MLHKNIIPHFTELYYDYFDNLICKNNIWTDQVVLTHIYKDKAELFHQLGFGYESVVKSNFLKKL